ncbi:MAG TPA: hypothetical protein DCZ91_10350 [Lachnospiraceae bacterium]|nr:hypothetical protein [Lachnospiraceae bacterium]
MECVRKWLQYSGVPGKAAGWRSAVGLCCKFILMVENICQPACIMSERIGNPELKAAIKCAHEYKRCAV